MFQATGIFLAVACTIALMIVMAYYIEKALRSFSTMFPSGSVAPLKADYIR